MLACQQESVGGLHVGHMLLHVGSPDISVLVRLDFYNCHRLSSSLPSWRLKAKMRRQQGQVKAVVQVTDFSHPHTWGGRGGSEGPFTRALTPGPTFRRPHLGR